MSVRSVAQAGSWSAIEIVLRQGVQFVVSVILARLLTPEDFGLVALLAFFTSLTIVVVQGGLTVALIQRQQTTHVEESAIFWWNMVASLVLGATFVAAAPWISGFFGQPVLRPLLVLAALQVVLSAAGAVHSALLTREMRFDLLTRSGVIASLTSGVVAVAAAAAGAGVWALALQFLMSAAINSAALWLLLDWRPLLHFRPGTIRQSFGFGVWVSVGNLLDVLYTNGFALLIGKVHGVRDLGFYNRAAATQLLPSATLSAIVGRVALPLLAARQDDPEALRQALRLGIGWTMLLNLPLMTGIALLAPDLVVVLFGERWLPAAPILAVLALGGILFPFHVINVQLVLARGQSSRFMIIETAKKAVGIAFVVVGSLFGVMGLAWSQVAYSVIGLLMNTYPAARDLDFGPLRQLREVTGPIAATMAMAAAVYALRQQLAVPPAAALVACTLAGAAVYAAAGLLLGSALFRDSLHFLVNELRRMRYARAR